MTRNEIQECAVKDIIKKKYNGLLLIAPRVGKTKILIDALRNFKGSITVIAPYNDILETWRKECEIWEFDKQITLVNQRSLSIEHKADLLICDECHTLSPNQVNNILDIKFSNILGATGTINDDSKKTIRPIINKLIYYYTIAQAIQDGIISNYNITVITLPLDNKEKYITAGTKTKPFLTTEDANYRYLTSQFNRFKVLAFKDKKYETLKYAFAGKRSRLLYSAKSKINLAKKILGTIDSRTLIFTVLTDVADQLSENSYHSNVESDNLSKFINEEIDVLSVCNMVSMGKTIPNLKAGLFHQLQSNSEAAQQKIMRMCNYVDKDTIAEIFILAYENTVDMNWLENALAPLNQNKIKYTSWRNY